LQKTTVSKDKMWQPPFDHGPRQPFLGIERGLVQCISGDYMLEIRRFHSVNALKFLTRTSRVTAYHSYAGLAIEDAALAPVVTYFAPPLRAFVVVPPPHLTPHAPQSESFYIMVFHLIERYLDERAWRLLTRSVSILKI
jgi:hypothetical protein